MYWNQVPLEVQNAHVRAVSIPAGLVVLER